MSGAAAESKRSEGTGRGGARGALRRVLAAREFGLLAGLILIGALFTYFTPNFLTPGNLLVVARQVSIILIIAIGMTFVILASGIDLSVGSVVALTSVSLGYFIVGAGLPLPVAILAALGVGALVGLINGALVVRTGVASFIVTLGMLGIARGVALGTSGGATQSGFPSAFLAIGQGRLLGIPIPVWIAAVIAIAAHIVLSRTVLGRHVYFLGSNQEAAILSGIAVNRLKFFIFILCSTLAAAASVIETARLSTAQPAAGAGYELLAIGAVIIGGASLLGGEGTILGTVLGTILLGVISNGLVLLGISAFWQQAVSGTIIILAVTLNTYRQRKAGIGGRAAV